MTGKSGFIGGPTDPFETPDAPEITGVSAGVLTADVTFTAPTDTGGAAIDSYVITAKQSDGTSVAQTASAAGTTSITLTAGGTTTFGAQAFNLYGAGQFSGLGNSTSVFTGQELYGWGQNNSGQLGLNDTTYRSSPVQIGALTTWGEVEAGGSFSTVITTNGELYAWGLAGSGQIGDNTTITKSSPVQIGALTNWLQVSGGNTHTVAVKKDGTLWAWGQGGSGRLGLGDTILRSSPVQVGALTNWSQVSASLNGAHTAAVKTDGTLWAWGYNAYFGQLGDSTTISRSSPVQVGALTNWSQVSAGRLHTIAVTTDGELYAWGSCESGELGINLSGATVNRRSSPVQIGSLTNWSSTSAGGYFSTAITTTGQLFAWGRGSVGRSGLNTTADRSSPTQIGALTNWSFVTAGNIHAGALKTDGTMWTWGSGSDGKLGDNTGVNRSSPVQIGTSTWTDISVGSTFTLAIRATTS